MKTYYQSTTTNEECEESKDSFWQSSSLQDQLLLTPVLAKLTRGWSNLMQQAARLICQAGQHASVYPHLLRTGLLEAWTNKRFRVGLIVGLVALPAWRSHLFFNIDQRIEDFYYVNYVFYFNTIRSYLSMFFLVSGFFIAAPQKWKFRWWALPVAMFCVVEITTQSYYTHWTDFYQPLSLWHLLTALVCIPALYVSIDYLVYRKNHLRMGSESRFIGMVKAPGIDAETKVRHLTTVVDEIENFNSRI
jgi:hypothetical protein